MIHEIPKEDIKITDKERFVTSLNHKFFWRNTTATIANLILMFLISIAISAVLIIVGYVDMVSEPENMDVFTASLALAGIIHVAFLVYCYNSIRGIVNTHEQISEIEDSLFEIAKERKK